MANFLEKILPAVGVRCGVLIRSGQVRQSFFDSDEALEAYLLAKSQEGYDTYFACSTYQNSDNRRQENVKAVQSFWLDIDAGPGKPYQDETQALEALDDFVSKTSLPAPVVVGSGYGLHVYFPLEIPLDRAQWEAYATRLESFAKHHGLEVDASRTTDLASILRYPGTLNFKRGGRASVRVIRDAEPNNEIINRLDQFYKKPDLSGITQLSLGDMPKGPPSMTQGYGDGERTNELTRRAGWCLGPQCMTEDQAVEACLEWNKYNTPPLDETKVSKTVRSIASREFSRDPIPTLPPPPIDPTGGFKFDAPSEHMPPLPDGFRWGSRLEVMARVLNPENENAAAEKDFIFVPVCDNPFYVLSVRENETKGVSGQKSALFMHRTSHTPWKSFVIRYKDLEGSTWKSELANFGVRCAPGADKQFKKYIYQSLQMRENMAAYDICYQSYGWKADHAQFVAGRKLYTQGKIYDVSGTNELEKSSDMIRPNPKGSLKGWRIAANKFFASGCEAQGFSLLAGMASPLMDFLYAGDEGGSVISLVTKGTGKGKTAVLAAVDSIWGDIGCLRLTNGDSTAAMFRAIGIRKNLPIVIDEYNKSDPAVLDERIALFTGGRDKKRLTLAGLDEREQLEWRTIKIVTSNAPLSDILKSHGYGAHAARILELNLTIPPHLADTITSDINQEFELNSGYAGPAFMYHLMSGRYDFDKLRLTLNELANSYALKIKKDHPRVNLKEYRFNLRLIAAVIMTATILSTPSIMGAEPFLEFSAKRIEAYALNQLIEEIKRATAQEKFESMEECEIISRYISENAPNFVVVSEPYNPKRIPQVFNVPRQKIMGRYEKFTQKLYIPVNSIIEFAVKCRVPYKELANILEEHKVLLNRSRKTQLASGTELPPTSLTCWEIDLGADKMLKVINLNDTGIVTKEII